MPDKYELFLDKNKKVKLSADEQGNFFAEANDKKIKLGASGLENVDENGVASPVGADLTALSQSIIPDTNEVYDLGSAEKKFRHLYLSSNSLFVGDTKITSDPTTGALTTAVSDGQGGFAEPAPVGGASSTFDWKGTSVNESVTTSGYPTIFSNGALINERFMQSQVGTSMVYIYPFDFPGNPESASSDRSGKPIVAGAPYDAFTVFFQDENGDSFPQWLRSKMDEENIDFCQFDVEFVYSFRISDINKADLTPFLTATPSNGVTGTNWGNAQTVNKKTFMYISCEDLYAQKSTLGWQGSGQVASGLTFHDISYDSNNLNLGGNGNNPERVEYSAFSPLVYLGQNHTYNQQNTRISLGIEFPSVNEVFTNDPNFDFSDVYGYWTDVQDGIEVDMFVKLRS